MAREVKPPIGSDLLNGLLNLRKGEGSALRLTSKLDKKQKICYSLNKVGGEREEALYIANPD